MGLLETVCLLRKRLISTYPDGSSSPPPPPQGKTIHNLPKTTTPSNFLITSVLTQGQIPWSVPIHESSAPDPCKKIHTQNQESTTR